MAQTLKLKRSSVPGKVPTTGSLVAGELAINTVDGKVYYRRDDDTIQTLVGTNTGITGSLDILGAVTASFFKGDGSAITGVISSSYSQFSTTASYALTASHADNFTVSGSITGVDYIDFDTTATVTQPTTGRLSWNDADGTLDIGLKGGNVTLQVGQETVARVVNKTGADLLEGDFKIVRIRSVAEGGAQGQRLAVVLAQADSDADSATTLGVVTEDIPVNQEGFITVFGLVRGINTTGAKSWAGSETWVDGDMLYLSPFHPGYLTNVKPTAPNHLVIIGYVEYAHPNNGKIFVKIDNGWEIGELHDVRDLTTSASYGDLLIKSGSVWTNSRQLTGSYSLTGSISGGTFIGSVSGSVTAPGATTQIIYNNAGVLSADSGLVYSGSNVGIGTTNPKLVNYGRELVVSQTSGLEPEAFLVLQGNRTGDNNIGGLSFYNTTSSLASIAGRRSGANNSGALTFLTSNAGTLTERLRILPNGTVGIGTSTAPDKLTVGDSAGTSISITTNQIPGSSASPLYTDLNFRGYLNTPMARIRSWDESSTTADGYLTFWTNDFTGSVNVFTEKMRITPTGNIGIGTITPSRRLEVRGNAGENTAIRISTSGTAFEVPTLEFYRNGTTNASIFYTPDGGSGQGIHLRDSRTDASGIMFETAGANERMRITHTGNVGIGTTNPSQKLTVAGDALITGSLTVNGTVTAREFKTEFVSASIIYQSGSTKFGDTFDDTHEFTGSIYLTSSQFTWNGQTVIASGVTSSMSVLNAITASNTILQSSILTNQTVGGLTSGTTLASGTGLESILRTILVTYIPPTLSSLVMRNGGSNISTSARDVGNSFTVNTASFSAVADNPTGIFPISSSWTASGADIGTATYYFGDNVLSTSNVRTVGSNYTINRATTSGTVTFTVNGRRSDSGAAITGTTTSVAFQWRNYLAASSTVPVDNSTAQTVVNAAVTSTLDTDRAWTATCTAANDTTGNFTYVIYPASYGNLSNIVQNGALSVLTAFTNLGDYTITNAYGASIVVRIYKSNSDKAFASGTTLAIS